MQEEKDKKINVYNIEVGKRYEIELYDCCIEGHFIAVLEKIIDLTCKDDDGKDVVYSREYHFDNGVVLTALGSGEAREIKE